MLLNRWVETEADCTLALSLDAGYVKAYLRRATARVEMGKVGSAERGEWWAFCELELARKVFFLKKLPLKCIFISLMFEEEGNIIFVVVNLS